MSDYSQVSTRDLFRRAAALLPILQSPQVYVETVGECRLTQAQPLAQRSGPEQEALTRARSALHRASAGH